MARETIPQLTYGGAANPLSLIPVAPLTSGSSDTDPTLNTYGDAECAFVKDVVGANIPTGIPTQAVWRLDSDTTATTAANNYAAHGIVLTPDHDVVIYGGSFQITTITGATYKVGVALWDNVNFKMTTAPVYSNPWTCTTGHARQDVAGSFATPLAVSQGQSFLLFFVRTDATGSTSATTWNTTGNPITQPGFYVQSTANCATDLASVNPLTSDVWTVSSAIWHVFNVLYGIP